MFDKNGFHDKLLKVPKMVLSKLLTRSSILYCRLFDRSQAPAFQFTKIGGSNTTEHSFSIQNTKSVAKPPANIHSLL